MCFRGSLLLILCLIFMLTGQELTNQKDSFYTLGNLTKNPDLSTLKKAYRNLSLTRHPDKTKEKPEEERAKLEKEFLKITSTYEWLTKDKETFEERVKTYQTWGETHSADCKTESECTLPRIMNTAIYYLFALLLLWAAPRASLPARNLFWTLWNWLTILVPRTLRAVFIWLLVLTASFELASLVFQIDWDEGPFGGHTIAQRVLMFRTVYMVAAMSWMTYRMLFVPAKPDEIEQDELRERLEALEEQLARLTKTR